MKLHQAASPVNHEAETRKLRNVLIVVSLKMAADDPGYAASLAGGSWPVRTGRRRVGPAAGSTCRHGRMN